MVTEVQTHHSPTDRRDPPEQAQALCREQGRNLDLEELQPIVCSMLQRHWLSNSGETQALAAPAFPISVTPHLRATMLIHKVTYVQAAHKHELSYPDEEGRG